MMNTTTALDVQSIAERLSRIPTFLEDEVGLINRRMEIRLLLICIIARLHILYFGTPGVAKSMTVDMLRRHFPDKRQFKTQLYKASPPEQLFGQISIKGMAEDKFYRLTAGKAPDAEIVVGDEIVRAPRAILPGLQGMMVEREFDSGNGVQPVPLETLIGTANHVPDDEELEAFFDRFTFKTVVQAAQSAQEFIAVMQTGRRHRQQGLPPVPDELIISSEELEAFREFVPTVVIPRSLELKMADLYVQMMSIGRVISPRRYQNLESAIQAAAALDGLDSANDDHLQLAAHSLWNRPEDELEVRKIVVHYASPYIKKTAELVEAFRDTLDRLGQIQEMIANGAQFNTKAKIGDQSDPDNKEKSLMDHGIALVQEHRRLRELIDSQIADAQGRDTSQLEAVLVQMDAAKDWVQDKLTMGLAL